MNDITSIILGVFTIVSIAITVFVIPYLKSKKSVAEWEAFMEKARVVTNWIVTAVKAAEMFIAGSGLGSEKNKYVLDYVKDLCEKNGITFDATAVSAEIEEIGQDIGLWGETKDETTTE
jgi:hypothetical protein